MSLVLDNIILGGIGILLIMVGVAPIYVVTRLGVIAKELKKLNATNARLADALEAVAENTAAMGEESSAQEAEFVRA